MAYHDQLQVNLEDPEPKNQSITLAIAVPVPGAAEAINIPDNTDHNTVLEAIAVNKRLSDKATDVLKRSTEALATLRGIAYILQKNEYRCERSNLNIHNIPRLVALAERDADIGYKASRIQLQTFDKNQQLEAEEHLAFAQQELESIEKTLKNSVERFKESDKLGKAIKDCIQAGHENLALL